MPTVVEALLTESITQVASGQSMAMFLILYLQGLTNYLVCCAGYELGAHHCGGPVDGVHHSSRLWS